MFWFFGGEARGILALQGSKLQPRVLEAKVLGHQGSPHVTEFNVNRNRVQAPSLNGDSC